MNKGIPTGPCAIIRGSQSDVRSTTRKCTWSSAVPRVYK
jgi:hypothetical protein